MKTIAKKTIKTLVSPEAMQTVASVELYEKVRKAVSPKTKKVPVGIDTNHTFAPDGVTRVTAEFNDAALGANLDATELGNANNALTRVNASMSERMAIVWKRHAGNPNISPAEAFRDLKALGYLSADTVYGGSEAERAINMGLFGKPQHPVFMGLTRTHWKTLERSEARKNEATIKTATAAKPKKAGEVETRNLTDAVATIPHIDAMVKTFLKSVPTDLQKSDLLKSVAKLLGFELEGFKSIKA